MLIHTHAGVLLSGSLGSQYTCNCGWLSKHYRNEAERAAAFAATEAHIAERTV